MSYLSLLCVPVQSKSWHLRCLHKAPDFVHLLHFCTTVNLFNKHSAGHDSPKLNRWHWFTQFLPVVFAKVITVLQRLVRKDVSFVWAVVCMLWVTVVFWGCLFVLTSDCNLVSSQHIVCINLCSVYCLCLWQIPSSICIGKIPGRLCNSASCSKLGQPWLYTSLLWASGLCLHLQGQRFFWAPVPILNYTQGSVSNISSAESLILLPHWRAWLCSL